MRARLFPPADDNDRRGFLKGGDRLFNREENRRNVRGCDVVVATCRLHDAERSCFVNLPWTA
jgi:hypothetical protein